MPDYRLPAGRPIKTYYSSRTEALLSMPLARRKDDNHPGRLPLPSVIDNNHLAPKKHTTAYLSTPASRLQVLNDKLNTFLEQSL